MDLFTKRNLLNTILKDWVVYHAEDGEIIYRSCDKATAKNYMDRQNANLVKNGIAPHWKMKAMNHYC